MSAHIKIMNVSKTFVDSSAELTALDNVCAEVTAGEFVSILGASGCGKSTLLRIIAGLDSATNGAVFCNGQKVTGTDSKRVLVFQEHTLLPWLTVCGNIKFALKGTKLYKREKDRISDWLKLAGLNGFEHSYPHQLSGGMKQRASLIRALSVTPDALLLDEPLGALDNFTRMTLQDELVRLWQKNGSTMVLVTHDVDEAVYLSQRVIVMSPRPGRIKEIVGVDLSYPRNRGDSNFIKLRTNILKHMDFASDVQEDFTI